MNEKCVSHLRDDRVKITQTLGSDPCRGQNSKLEPVFPFREIGTVVNHRRDVPSPLIHQPTHHCCRQGSRIEAACVVVKPTKPYTINRGVPSQRVGWIVCDPYQDVGVGEVKEVGEADEREGDAEDAVKPRRVFSNYGSLYVGV